MALEICMEDIFFKSQFKVVHHPKLIQQLRLLYQEKETSDKTTFLKKFVECLQVTLIHGEKQGVVERTLDFAAKFCVALNKKDKIEEEDELDEEEEEEMCPFLIAIFNFLFKNHQCNNQSIRFRVCQFINKILQNLGEEAFIDDGLCNEISEYMMERLQDKAPAVRSQAVMALLRLQDPTNPNCPVIKAYIFHMTRDPSPDVRRTVLMCIGRSHITLPHIQGRTRDVKDIVRKQAYLVISKLHVRSFTIKQRNILLKEGLQDRSELVRTSVEKVLLPAWLNNYDGNYLLLLRALDVESSTEASLLAMKAFFKYNPQNNFVALLKLEHHLVPVDALTSESAFLWRCLAQHLNTNGDAEDLEEVIPNLTPFCDYVKQYMEKLKKEGNEHAFDRIQHDFVVLQLMEMAKVFDLADEVGRSNLKQLLIDLLLSSEVTEKLVPIMVELLGDVIPDVNTRLQTLAEVISEIHQPLSEVVIQITQEERQQRDLQKAQVRARKMELQEDLDEAIKEKNFMRAQEMNSQLTDLDDALQKLMKEPDVITQEIRHTRNDPQTLVKCLSIVYEIMQSPSITNLTPHLRSLLQNFVIINLKVEDAQVQVMALKAMAVFCLLEKELAQQNLMMFYYYLGNGGVDEVCLVSLKAIFDMLLMYGLQTFAIEEDNTELEEKRRKRRQLRDETGLFEDTNQSIQQEDDTLSENSSSSLRLLSVLATLLDNTTGKIRSTAAEGFCKLFLASKISSPILLSRLIILWYNPLTEDDTYLRQALSVFFTMYATSCPSSQDILEQAFLPTIRTFLQAPHASPLVTVETEEVAKFLLGLSKPGINNQTPRINVHNNLAVSLCNEILKEPDSVHVKELLKILGFLELSLDNTQKQVLLTLANQMSKEIIDKAFVRYLNKFQHILKSDEVSLPGEEDILVNTTAMLSLNPRISLDNSMNTVYPSTTDISTISENDDESIDESDEVFDIPANNKSCTRTGLSKSSVKKKSSISSTRANVGNSRISAQSVSSTHSLDPPHSRRTRAEKLSQESQLSEEPRSSQDGSPTPFTCTIRGVVVPESSDSDSSLHEEPKKDLDKEVPSSNLSKDEEESPKKKIRMTRKRNI